MPLVAPHLIRTAGRLPISNLGANIESWAHVTANLLPIIAFQTFDFARDRPSHPPASLRDHTSRPRLTLLIETPRYESWLIKSNNGMYIAMTIPPTMTPSTQISAGSRIVSNPAIATSTSSS